jgi:hypothetical protein
MEQEIQVDVMEVERKPVTFAEPVEPLVIPIAEPVTAEDVVEFGRRMDKTFKILPLTGVIHEKFETDEWEYEEWKDQPLPHEAHECLYNVWANSGIPIKQIIYAHEKSNPSEIDWARVGKAIGIAALAMLGVVLVIGLIAILAWVLLVGCIFAAGIGGIVDPAIILVVGEEEQWVEIASWV